MMRIARPAAIAALLAFASVGGLASRASADGEKTPPVFRFQNEDRRLSVEVLDDDLFHFEYRIDGKEQTGAIPVSPMVVKTDYTGAMSLKRAGDRIESAEICVEIDPTAGKVDLVARPHGQQADVVTQFALAHERPRRPDSAVPAVTSIFTLSFASEKLASVYGLGEQLLEEHRAPLDWVKLNRSSNNRFGNQLAPFRGGAVGNAQFPVAFLLGKDDGAIAVFIDSNTKTSWRFDKGEWRASCIDSDVLRWYVLAGPTLADVRRDFMELVGRPPVPPRSAFGLWVSEYGYDDWAELEDKLKTLKAAKFPLDGMVLDLQWFGGIGKDGKGSRMGALDWDRKAFPDPAKKIAELREKHGIGIIPIEEPYVSTELADFKALEKDNVLVKSKENGPAAAMKSWWGTGGMVDFTSESAGNEWHDRRRKALIDAGVAGHWTDLGEPENYPDAAWYHGFGAGHDQAANHNLYNFGWSASIANGYRRHNSNRRPFILSRSGTAGSQRFGVAMWSGDIGANMPSLRAHFRAQAHMSLSGIDYFGSDIGGFHRQSLDGDLNDLYTRWFANSCLIDVPVRPHTSNTDNSKETAPDRIGHLESNLANIRRRYELIPYLYSLAHEANRTGEPVFPPLVYHFENDDVAQTLTDHKMIGPWLLAAMIVEYKTTDRRVYLPKGVWFDFGKNSRFESKGEWIKDVSYGKVMAPLFAREGAIIPLATVDEHTMNASGRRDDGTYNDTMRLRIYPSQSGSSFTIYEDDGETIAYQSGGVRVTTIHQKMTGNEIVVALDASSGDYSGSVKERPWEITHVLPYGASVLHAEVNGQAVEVVRKGPRINRVPKHPPGWHWTIRTPPLDAAKAYRVTLTVRGKP